MNLPKRACVLGAILALGLTGACTPSTPAPTPTPVPSASPPETDLEREQRLGYATAEKSYRLFQSEYGSLRKRGYSGRPTREMKATAAGPYLKAYSEFLKSGAGSHSVGDLKIAYVRGVSYSKDRIDMTSCEDGRAVERISTKNGRLMGKGTAGILDLVFRPVDGTWKVWDATDKEVASCGD